MRLYPLLVFFLSAALASRLPETKRGLADAIDPFQAPSQPQETRLEHTTERVTTSTHLPTSTGSLVFPGLISSLDSTAKSKETSTASHSQTIPAGISSSVAPTSQLPITPTPTSANRSLTSSVAASPSPTKPSGGQSISRSTQEWKIIGVAVIAFSAVTAILLLAVFFDQWWGFLRDLVWKKKRKDAFEEFIPDWEKASWEVRIDADRHRYPAISSSAKKAGEQEQDLHMEKDFNDPFNTEYMTGVGSGYASNLYTPQITHSNAGNGLGILTPIPQARFADRPAARSASLNRSNSRRHAPVALTDPYGGIE